MLAVDELAVAWLDDEGCFGALDELVGVRLRLGGVFANLEESTFTQAKREPRNFYHRRRTSPAPPIRSGTRVAGVCPRPLVLEDVCDPPGTRGAHGQAFLCIRTYIRPHFVSRARRE